MVDATQWAIDQGIADTEPIAINGGNYGGSASAMGLLRDPGLFKSLYHQARNAGRGLSISIPATFSGPVSRTVGTVFWRYEQSEDVVQMHQRSPVNLVDKMQADALIMAGKRDRVVGFEQTKRFIAKAKALGKNITP